MLNPLSPSTLTTLLAGLMLLGNVPAWLHVGLVGASPAGAVSGSSGHGCCSHCRFSKKPSSPAGAAAVPADHGHDSDDCVACRLAAKGLPATPPAPGAAPASPLAVFVATAGIFIGWIAPPVDPHSRGPPLV